MTMISVGTFTTRIGIARRGIALSGAVGLCLLSAVAAAQTPPPAAPEPEPAPAPADPAAPDPAAPVDAAPAPLPAAPGDAPPDATSLDADLEVGDAPTSGLDEVVVTVDRRTKNLQKYSGTAAAFSESQLSAIGIGNVRELSSMVPGLQIGVQEGNTEVYIRGVGSDNNTELGDEAVALHLDGVYLPRPRGVGSMFFDIERVEVNSGPQGTLRGRNAVGGSVNIVSNKPKLSEFGANAEATFGTFASRRYQGMVNIPLGDTLAVRFAAFSEVHDPYYENAGPLYDIPAGENADSYAYRVQLKWQPVPAFTALAAYDYTAERGTGYLGANMQGPLTQEDTQAAADADAAAAAMANGTMAPDPNLNDIATPYDITQIDNPRRSYLRGMNPSVNLRHQGARLELTYDTGPVIVSATGSYRDLKYDQVNGGNAGAVYPGYGFAATNPDNFGGAFWHTTSKSTIAELRAYAPDTARFRWALGGFYFNEDQYAFLGQTSDPANGFAGGEFNMPDVKGGSIAAYADGTFDITESLRALGGVRVTNEHKSRKNGLWALWVNPGNLGRFGTEGFRYAMEDRTIFDLAPTANLQQRVDAFLNGIKSFGARDEVPQRLCADPPAAAPGMAQQPRVEPNGTGGMRCTNGLNPALVQQQTDFDNNVAGSSKPFNINMIPQNDEIKGETFFDWRVGGELDLAKDSMLYATVTTGHKAGGFNDTIRDAMTQEPTNPPQYTPESVLSFEIGSKNQLLDRHLRLNASAFLYRYTDQVFQTIVTVTPDNSDEPGDQSSSIAVRQNAKNTTNVLGLDADITYSLPLGLEAELHALLLDARFADGTIVNDSRIGFDVSAYRVDIGGNQLPRAAPITLNYTLSQFLPSAAGIFHWLVSAQTVTKHYMSVYNGHGNLLPSVDGTEPNTQSYRDLARPNGAARLTDEVPTYTRFDIGAGWKHADSRLSIDAFVNNVGNIAYPTSIISTPGLNLRFFNPPRTAGVKVRVDW